MEALVQADKALYAGVHSPRIRKVFYEDVKFIGGTSGHFRQVEAGVVEVGLHSCAGIAFPTTRVNGPLSVGVAFLWWAISLVAGRFYRSRFR